MKLFLDTSVLLAAAGSARGSGRFVVVQASVQDWELISADYCAEEARPTPGEFLVIQREQGLI